MPLATRPPTWPREAGGDIHAPVPSRRGDRQEHHREERPPSPPSKGDGLTGILRHFLDQFHLEGVDTGDLLLLGLLFLLSQEKADEETLIALGLLLIL